MNRPTPASKPAAAPQGVKSIQSLQRGLDVLRALRLSSAASLADLHRDTGLSKATLLRILKTLQAGGWIERDDLAGRYAPTADGGTGGRAVAWHTQLSALAARPRETLQQRVPWPTDLAVRDGTVMLILDTHQPTHGLSVNYRALGFRPSMPMSSLGRCYLAFCPDEERAGLVAALARSRDETARTALRPQALRRLAAQARGQGYIARDPSLARPDSPERFGAISVPVFADGRIVACLSCAWLPAVTDEAQIVQRHLGDLRDCAQAIGARLDRARFRLPAG